MYALKEAMRWDEVTYGREYDLDIYMIVAIHDFNMGAMENKGLNIFNTKYVLAKQETATDDDFIHVLSVVAHEYFHNWTGNRVTCRDWFQLSLKEGLTIFRDQTFSEDLISKAVMRIRDVTYLREAQFPEDAGPLAHPVCPDSYIEINNFYTATIYNKGAEVLRMLQTILGKDLFRKGMDLYFTRYDGQAVTILDYIKMMEEVSVFDLTQFKLWYKEIGTPIVTVSDDYDESRALYTLTMHQTIKQTDVSSKKPLHIPIRMGLLNQKGEPIPLDAEDPACLEKVLHLTESAQIFQFKNIPSRPIPSLLRNFSAPVKLHYPYVDEDLLFLFQHDQDSFNRFEAGQRYTLRVILNLIRDYQQKKSLFLPKELSNVYQYILKQAISKEGGEDLFLISEMLYLPSQKYIGEQMEVVDVDAIFSVREFVAMQLAEELQSTFVATYERLQQEVKSNQFNRADLGKRQLKNTCLAYLMRLSSYLSLGMKQFETSLQSNMTDTQAALIGLSNADSPLREKALDQFYATWKKDALVIDKWFSIQAETKLPIALQEVKKLMQHHAFDIKNPNNVYALIGSFGHRNLVHFHAKHGEGYAFLSEVVLELDPLNPQVAARMINPLTHWMRYDKARQILMRNQLEKIKNKKISAGLYELVTKSLE